MYCLIQGEVHPSPFLVGFYTAELREAPSKDEVAIFPMGLGPAVAQVGVAELGAVAELGPVEQGPAVTQVGAAELGRVELSTILFSSRST